VIDDRDEETKARFTLGECRGSSRRLIMRAGQGRGVQRSIIHAHGSDRTEAASQRDDGVGFILADEELAARELDSTGAIDGSAMNPGDVIPGSIIESGESTSEHNLSIRLNHQSRHEAVGSVAKVNRWIAR